MNEQLQKDLDYLYGTLQREGVVVTDVTADEAIKDAETAQGKSRRTGDAALLLLGRATEIQP